MEFKVISGEREDHFHGDSSYSFNEHGLLVVTSDQGYVRTYSPSGWDYLDKAPDGGGWVMSV